MECGKYFKTKTSGNFYKHLGTHMRADEWKELSFLERLGRLILFLIKHNISFHAGASIALAEAMGVKRLWSERRLALLCDRLCDEFLIPEMKRLIAEADLLRWAQDATSTKQGKRWYLHQVGCINIARAECTDLVVDFFSPTEDRLTAPIVALHTIASMQRYQAASGKMISMTSDAAYLECKALRECVPEKCSCLAGISSTCYPHFFTVLLNHLAKARPDVFGQISGLKGGYSHSVNLTNWLAKMKQDKVDALWRAGGVIGGQSAPKQTSPKPSNTTRSPRNSWRS
jgi:hypothetical protein